MTTMVLAHVRRILTGHSDRALLHAVDNDGLEYKIEVPAAAVRGSESEPMVVMVAWSLLVIPKIAGATQSANPAAPPRPPLQASPSPQTSSNEDATFAALMANRQRSSTEQSPAAAAQQSVQTSDADATFAALMANRQRGTEQVRHPTTTSRAPATDASALTSPPATSQAAATDASSALSSPPAASPGMTEINVASAMELLFGARKETK